MLVLEPEAPNPDHVPTSSDGGSLRETDPALVTIRLTRDSNANCSTAHPSLPP
jgi:hypothetical protein